MILEKLLPTHAIEKIGKLVERPINQTEKADKYKKLLKEHSFRQLDMGTNRQIYTHDDYPKSVFKVALDEQGVLDNLNEYEKSDKTKYFPESHGIDKDGYILVQQRTPVMELDFFNKKETQKRVREILKELDQAGFVLLDLGSDKHKNYGMDKKGNIYILDFGYVEYKSLANFNCPHVRQSDKGKKKYCGGKLEYTKNFTMLQCTDCETKFRVDVVLGGYTHEMYAEPPKQEEFQPSQELENFYKKFNKSRDRSTLTKYVELSNKPATQRGEIAMDEMSQKDKFLAKSRGISLKPLQEQLKEAVRHAKEPDNDEIYDASTKPVIHDQNLEDDVEEEIQSGEYASAAKRLMETLNISGEDADNIISTLFYERFPEVKEIVESYNMKEEFGDTVDAADNVAHLLTSYGPDTVELNTATAGDNYADICRDEGIEINIPTDSLLKNEIHIGMVVEDLKKRPIIVISEKDTVYFIDLLEHTNRLTQFIGDNGHEDMIVTSMVAEPVSQFNKNYDNRYFESE